MSIIHSDKTYRFFFILFSITIYSCTNVEHESTEYKPPKEEYAVWQEHVDQGKIVFDEHCAKCHAGNRRRCSPRWAELTHRIPGGDETIIKFIVSSSRLRKDSNEYVINIKEEYNSTPYEHEFGEVLTKTELHNLMVYIKHEFGGEEKRY